MTRQCEICGAEIKTSAGVCEACGMAYAAEGEPDLTSYNNPRWGKIVIETSKLPSKDREKILGFAKEIWSVLEINTSQKLFPGQFLEVMAPSDRVELYGPYSSYLGLEKRLCGQLARHDILTFSDLTTSEIYQIRGGITVTVY